MTEVENGFKVVNVDNTQLNKLKRDNNTLDCGAEKVLESLDLFCEDLEDKYSYVGSVPYENMFNALRCVIRSAYENEQVRNAILTGIIQETSEVRVTPKQKKAEPKKDKVILNMHEVMRYSVNHTISETAEYFGSTREQMKNFINTHKLPFIKDKSGKKSVIDEETVRRLAPTTRVTDLAKLFMVSRPAMSRYLKAHGIKCKNNAL